MKKCLFSNTQEFLHNIFVTSLNRYQRERYEDRIGCYAPKGHPPQFYFDVNICKEKHSLWIGVCGNGRLVGPFFL